ncbi:MAG: dihydroorotase [Eubacteriaceae bacterium]
MIIKNVKIIDAKKNTHGDVLIKDGLIKEVCNTNFSENEEIIDGTGYVLMPSFIDFHCHLRDPGFEYKEDMESGMIAALKGGYTHLVAMANTKPIIDNAKLLEDNYSKSDKLNLCDLTQICALTKKFESELVDFENLLKYTPVFSNDGLTIENDEIMIKALKASEELNFYIATHCQPETSTVRRDMELLKNTKGNIHVCHVSKEDTVSLIREAKKNGYNVTCEVTPHHIFESEIKYRVNPPFRKESDRLALIKSIKEGIIDICATDHAPHSQEDKNKGMPGIGNIEVAFSMYWHIFSKYNIHINKLSEMMSYTPAKLLGLNCGLIEPGYEANLVLIDLEKIGVLDVNSFVSKSKNNPFHNYSIKGEVIITIKRGEIKYDNR